MRFRDREDAGRYLGQALLPWRAAKPVVIGLPRGGVPVAAEVAKALGAPLDVLVVRKLGHPQQPELAMGAIGEGGVRVLNHQLLAELRVPRSALEHVAAREEAELVRRVARYRGSRARVPVQDRTVILVDDGLATGSSALAAIAVLRENGATQVVLAVPVAPAEAIRQFRSVADDVVCLLEPAWFRAVGEWYEDFGQVGDKEVARLLAQADSTVAAAPGEAAVERDVAVVAKGRSLPGTLVVPGEATGLVLFAHGSGSSRHSPRNRYVAEVLNQAGVATLLFDLLTDAEAEDRRNVFDIGLLARRLAAATEWCDRNGVAAGRPVGYFGASTGAGAALVAAAELGPAISAVVSRGGRPDLAGGHLAAVTAPTLLVVGGRDVEVLELNRRAAAGLVRCDRQLVVVPGATHLFEEPGTLPAVAELATRWFADHFAAPTTIPTRRATA